MAHRQLQLAKYTSTVASGSWGLREAPTIVRLLARDTGHTLKLERMAGLGPVSVSQREVDGGDGYIWDVTFDSNFDAIPLIGTANSNLLVGGKPGIPVGRTVERNSIGGTFSIRMCHLFTRGTVAASLHHKRVEIIQEEGVDVNLNVGEEVAMLGSTYSTEVVFGSGTLVLDRPCWFDEATPFCGSTVGILRLGNHDNVAA
jgi:hypothetical protein